MVTPSIPERHELLVECVASVREQTLQTWQYEHLVLVDTEREGCSKTVNKAAAEARGDWIFLLADDDLLLPGCLKHHLAFSEQADIVYSPPLVWGEDYPQFHGSPPTIPSTCLIRAELWRTLNGYDERLGATEDRNLYERAIERYARFVRADQQPTWVYRFHGRNKSRQPASADR